MSKITIKCGHCKTYKPKSEYAFKNETELYKCCERCREQAKESRNKYVEIRNAKWREYYYENRDKIQEQQRAFREQNKERINARYSEKIQCDICNSYIRRDGMLRHKKTQKCRAT